MRLLFAALLIACTSPRTPPVAPVPRASMQCVKSGRFKIPPGATLAIDGTPRLRFRGAPVNVEATLDGNERVAAVVQSGGFRFAGSLDAMDVPLRAAKPIPIVAGHVWIETGAPIAVLPGARVTSHYTEGIDIDAPATCDQIEVNEQTIQHDDHGDPYHLAQSTFTLVDAPNGHTLATLKPRSSQIYTLYSDRVDRGYVHVRKRDWISVDGWVKSSELVAGYGGDCDDCRGGIMDVEDRCPDEAGEDDIDGCPVFKHELGRVAVATDVFADGGANIGSVDGGSEVVILERSKGRARVVPRNPDVLPVKTGWWIAESAIKPSQP